MAATLFAVQRRATGGACQLCRPEAALSLPSEAIFGYIYLLPHSEFGIKRVLSTVSDKFLSCDDAGIHSLELMDNTSVMGVLDSS